MTILSRWSPAPAPIAVGCNRDRSYDERSFGILREAELQTKSPHALPRTKLADHRDLIEAAFPEPIPF